MVKRENFDNTIKTIFMFMWLIVILDIIIHNHNNHNNISTEIRE